MRLSLFFLWLLLLAACSESPKPRPFTEVSVEVLWQDSVSIRALEIMPGSVGFAGSGGVFGTYTLSDRRVRTGRQVYEGAYPEFRAVAHTARCVQGPSHRSLTVTGLANMSLQARERR